MQPISLIPSGVLNAEFLVLSGPSPGPDGKGEFFKKEG